MTYPLYIEATISRDLPQEGLHRGDPVHLVDHLIARDGSEVYVVELIEPKGRFEVATVPVEFIKPVGDDEVASGRLRPGP